MSDKIVKLSEVKDPTFKFELRDGSVKEVDPFEVAERLQDAREGESAFDTMRRAFFLPTQAEVDEAKNNAAQSSDSPIPYLATRNEILFLTNEVQAFTEGLDIAKKISARTAKLLSQFQSNQANG